jgi:hypothetical protein
MEGGHCLSIQSLSEEIDSCHLALERGVWRGRRRAPQKALVIDIVTAGHGDFSTEDLLTVDVTLEFTAPQSVVVVAHCQHIPLVVEERDGERMGLRLLVAPTGRLQDQHVPDEMSREPIPLPGTEPGQRPDAIPYHVAY